MSGALSLFFSKQLKLSETRYSILDREVLAIYLAVKHSSISSKDNSSGSTQTTNHSHMPCPPPPLIIPLAPLCHLDFISQFTTDIRHIKGADNSAVDTLSRVEVNTVDKDSHTVIDFAAMAAAQQSDPDLHKLQSSTTSLSLKTTPAFHRCITHL